MAVQSVYSCPLGLLCFLVLFGVDCFAHSILHYEKRSSNNDDSSQKLSYIVYNQSTTSSNDDVIILKTPTPSWQDNLLSGRWYGSDSYMKRTMYLKNPNKRPTVCYSNVTKVENGSVIYNFICPRSHQNDKYIHCCGNQFDQRCCTVEEKNRKQQAPVPEDIDVVTAIGIAVGCVLSVTICMTLYCCCCQRRPEIQDGIKLMWVKRSFGKELNKIGEPSRQDSLQVHTGAGVRGSRSGSRNPSRGGSPHHSRRGSRTQSDECSPSVSRRGSRNSSHKQKGGENKGKLKVPEGVTITLTTPSDEQGPTNPLLKQTQEHIEST